MPQWGSVPFLAPFLKRWQKSNIVKEEVDEYEYKNQRTGELMLLNHSYAFQPEGATNTIGQTKVMEMELA